MEDNYAAILMRIGRKPFNVEETDARYPDENEIVIKNAAVSINPIDGLMQNGEAVNMTIPAVLGADVAGEVVEVGSQVTRFSVGDRVMGHALRLATDDDRHAGFQNHTVLWPNMATKIPPSLSYEDAATMPLGISTAAAALFQKESLGLERDGRPRDEWVIVAGATGNVGSHGVRLASAAGYKVLGTASASSFNLARTLGATDLVDYRTPDLAGELARRLAGQKIAGAFDAGGKRDSILPVVQAVAKCDGKKVVSSVADELSSKDIPNGVTVVPIFAIAIREGDVGEWVWGEFLPNVLSNGKYYLPYPRARVFGNGLDQIQAAMDNEEKKDDGTGKPGRAPAGQKTVVTLK
ncbi:putative zinc-binding oxidoreductase [Rosellinia necatrix]|uniref:Putative zinc-binding oxidoreductase n=1 Tax=Rosellinia necatrix TaxID=77044 RepID=A0A1W2TC19_ROSNE|nr:putative zinc-binding oxidoreductase [Rosellinia necatrix]